MTSPSQALSIAIPDNFDPFPSLTSEAIRSHLTAVRNHLVEARSNPRIVGEEGAVLDLMIGRIDSAPSNAGRDYLIALLREATSALQRREGMNTAEASYDIPADLTVTARAQLRMKHVRAERQMRLNWARSQREELDNNAAGLAREAADREATLGAVEDLLTTMNDALDDEVQIARAKATGTAVVPDMGRLIENIMTIGIDKPALSAEFDGPALRPRVRMGF